MSDQLSYERSYPNATYAPWLTDVDFRTTLAQVANNTIVDHLRCYELWQLVAQTVRLRGDIIEIGVWRGGTGCLMARRAQLLNSSAKVFLCDTFAGVVKAGDKDSFYRGGEHADTSATIVQELADAMGLSNVELLTGIFPDETARQVSNRKFSLCHIDVDVYDSARDILDWVWPRLSVGGVVVYDDYGFDTCSGITRLVNDRAGQPGSITLHNINGHAVVVKTADAAKPLWKRLLG